MHVSKKQIKAQRGNIAIKEIYEGILRLPPTSFYPLFLVELSLSTGSQSETPND